jgi:hypothetical protein
VTWACNALSLMRRTPLLRLALLSKVYLQPSAVSVSAPAAWFVRHLAVFVSQGLARARARLRNTFRRIRSASEYDPSRRAPSCSALTRFRPPQRYPTVEVHLSRVLSISGLVASSRLPRASTLYSLGCLPGVFSTRCAHGVLPFRACPCDRCSRLSTRSCPSCDWPCRTVSLFHAR